MFPSAKKSPIPTIRFIRGNIYVYRPELFLNDEPKTTVGEDECMMLIVKSYSGNTYLSKTIVGTVEGSEIVFTFLPEDTINMEPYAHYEFSIDLFKGDGKEFYKTLQKGVFHLRRSVGDYTDIKE